LLEKFYLYLRVSFLFNPFFLNDLFMRSLRLLQFFAQHFFEPFSPVPQFPFLFLYSLSNPPLQGLLRLCPQFPIHTPERAPPIIDGCPFQGPLVLQISVQCPPHISAVSWRDPRPNANDITVFPCSALLSAPVPPFSLFPPPFRPLPPETL